MYTQNAEKSFNEFKKAFEKKVFFEKVPKKFKTIKKKNKKKQNWD